MDNPKYIQVMRQVASDFDGISHELFQVASDLERMDQYNPQQKLFSLVRSAEVSSVRWTCSTKHPELAFPSCAPTISIRTKEDQICPGLSAMEKAMWRLSATIR